MAVGATAQDFNLYGFNTIDYNLLGAGARARAMGGAFVGLADDASALTWNPAGLIQIDRTQTSLSGTYVQLKQKSTISSRAFDVEAEEEKLKLSYASFVAPLRIKGHPFMAAASYRAAQDRLEDWYSWAQVDEEYVPPSDTITYAYTAERANHTTITGGLDVFSFGFGTGFYGDLAIGASLNIYTGSGEAAYQNSYLDTVFTESAGVRDTIQLRRIFTVDNLFDQTGANFSVSAFYQLEKIQAGVVIQTPFQLTTEHDLARRDTVFENGLPTFPNINRAWKYLGKTKIDMPLTVSGGLAVKPAPNFTLTGDLEVKSWSGSIYAVERDTSDLFVRRGSMYFPYDCADADTCDVSRFTSAGDKVEVYDEFELNLDNTYSLRLGAEYLLQTSIGEIPLRGGLRFLKQQYTDVSGVVRDKLDQVQEGFTLEERVSNTTITFGSGIHWRQIWLDFAVELSSEEQVESGTDYLGSYEVVRERTNPSLTLNFTGFF
jgi:long-subunit fatty acid transport protein